MRQNMKVQPLNYTNLFSEFEYMCVSLCVSTFALAENLAMG